MLKNNNKEESIVGALPQARHSIHSIKDIETLIEDTNREYLRETLNNILNKFAFLVWFGRNCMYTIPIELAKEIGVEQIRKKHTAEIPIITKTEWRKQCLELKRKRENDKRFIKEYLQFRFNELASAIDLDQINSAYNTTIELEDFKEARLKHMGRQNGHFVFDIPSNPTGLISANCLCLHKKLWTEDHCFARQRSGEHIFEQFLEGKLTFERMQYQINNIFNSVNYLTSKENTKLVNEQKNPANDFTDWESMYNKIGIILFEIIEIKDGFVTLVKKDGIIMKANTAIELYATLEEK